MKKRILALAGAIVLMTGIWGNAAAVYARTIESGTYSTARDWNPGRPNDNRYTSGGPGTTTGVYNGAYGYPGGPGNVYSNTLGTGQPAVSGGNATYYTGSWQQDANGWWYQFSNGTYPKNCWIVVDGSYYCFDSTGHRRYGWINWNNKWYYCGTDGALVANAYTPDGYYVGSDGVWVR
jgi:hypothetical protein